MKVWGCVLFVCCLVCGQELPSDIGLRSFTVPEYPMLAREARIQGDVCLNVTLDSGGKVVAVDSSTGPAILAASAKANIALWTYTPTGHALRLKVVYTYRLEMPEKSIPPAPRIRLECPDHIVITSNLPQMEG